MRCGVAVLVITVFTFSVQPAGGQVVPGQMADYSGHRVVRVQLANQEQLDQLLTMTDDVWSENIGVGPLDVRVSPAQFQRLQTSGLPFTVLIEDVQPLIDRERAGMGIQRGAFDNYMDYATVLSYMNQLAALRPDLATIFTIGATIEGRQITGIRVTGPGGGARPGVLYHGCSHAREWITVPVTLYVADQLVRNYDSDPGVRELVDRAEWYLIPVFNADGYVYTWTTDRLWRKNRRNNGNGTFGVDNNRNWGHQWGGEGASTNPGNETYRGTAPFSEPENQRLRDFILSHPNIVAYNDIHSYSQLLLWPWGYTAAVSPDNATFAEIGNTMVSIIAGVHGMSYTPGPIYTTIYPASGVSADWVYGVAGAWAFSFELRDTGENGFLLPANQIIPTCQEIFPSLMYCTDYTTAAVRISFPDGLPAALEPGVANTLNITITAANEGVNTGGATLHVRTSAGGSFTSYPVAHLGGTSFRATFPARGCGDPTEFYVRATGTGGGIVHSPTGAPLAVHSVPVGTEQTIFADNFQADTGWSVQNQNLAAGAWVRVDPNGTTQNGPAQPEDDNPAGTGTLCYVTGQGSPGGQVGAADVDGGPTRLLSPALALASEPEAVVSYYRWHYSFGGNADTFTVEVSNNNGTSWVPVEAVGHAPGWTKRTFRVADYVTPTNQVRVRFSAIDSPNDSITEAGVDDFTVGSFSCQNTELNGDTNCDGSVNPFDINSFLLALNDLGEYQQTYCGGSTLNADVNDDGSVNAFDIQSFVDLLSP